MVGRRGDRSGDTTTRSRAKTVGRVHFRVGPFDFQQRQLPEHQGHRGLCEEVRELRELIPLRSRLAECIMTAANDLFLGVEIEPRNSSSPLAMPAATCSVWSPIKSPSPTGRRTCWGWLRRQIPPLIGREVEFGGKSGPLESDSAACWKAARRDPHIRAGARLAGLFAAGLVRAHFRPGPPSWPTTRWPAVMPSYCCGSGVEKRHFFYSNIGSGIGGALFSIACPTTDWEWA